MEIDQKPIRKIFKEEIQKKKVASISINTNLKELIKKYS